MCGHNVWLNNFKVLIEASYMWRSTGKPSTTRVRKYWEKIDSGNILNYDDETWKTQHLDADNSVSEKFFSKGAALCPVFL